MARIEIRVFAGVHLYYEFIDDNGNRIKQINALGTNPNTGIPELVGGPNSVVRVYDNKLLSSSIFGNTQDINERTGTTIFSGSEAQVLKALAYVQAFMDFINPNSEYLPYGATPLEGSTYNSNSGANTLGNIIALAVSVDHSILNDAKSGFLGVLNDILRGQTWSPIFSGGVITGSHVVGTNGKDKMNNGRDADDVLVGMGGNDTFGAEPKNTGPDGRNTIYGGTESHKVQMDSNDGVDTYIYETGGALRTVSAYADRWEVTTAGDASDTDTLYSIEHIIATAWHPENKGDFHHMNGALELKDLNASDLAAIQADQPLVTEAVWVTTGGTTGLLANFGTFVGTDYNDSFTVGALSGRRFDGGDGVDTLSFVDLNDTHGLTFNLADGSAYITGSNVLAGPGIGGPYDALMNIEHIIGSAYDDIFYAAPQVQSLTGGTGSDIYHVSWGGAMARVIENAGDAGTDAIGVPDTVTTARYERVAGNDGQWLLKPQDGQSGAQYTIPTGVENVMYSGGGQVPVLDFPPHQDKSPEPFGPGYHPEAPIRNGIGAEGGPGIYSPLVLDLDTYGVTYTNAHGAGSVYWDIDSDGFREQTSWIGPEDAFLSLDRNGRSEARL